MSTRQPLPLIWLLSDARNDGALEAALAQLPPRSGFVYRHYHLGPKARLARYDLLMRVGRDHGHLILLASDNWDMLDAWGGDGLYCNKLAPEGPVQTGAEIGSDAIAAASAGSSTETVKGSVLGRAGRCWLTSAHNAHELQRANDADASGVFISPVFATRSHPGAKVLGHGGFHQLARQSTVPVIALGGMTAARASSLNWPRWGAIDGLV